MGRKASARGGRQAGKGQRPCRPRHGPLQDFGRRGDPWGVRPTGPGATRGVADGPRSEAYNPGQKPARARGLSWRWASATGEGPGAVPADVDEMLDSGSRSPLAAAVAGREKGRWIPRERPAASIRATVRPERASVPTRGQSRPPVRAGSSGVTRIFTPTREKFEGAREGPLNAYQPNGRRSVRRLEISCRQVGVWSLTTAAAAWTKGRITRPASDRQLVKAHQPATSLTSPQLSSAPPAPPAGAPRSHGRRRSARSDRPAGRAGPLPRPLAASP